MLYIGIDPGETIGYAEVLYTGPDEMIINTRHSALPLEVWGWVACNRMYDLDMKMQLLVENYIGGGVQSKYGLETIKRVGYFQYRAQEAGIPVLTPIQQHRLSGVTEAETHANQRDEVAALAHVLAHIEREHRGQ